MVWNRKAHHAAEWPDSLVLAQTQHTRAHISVATRPSGAASQPRPVALASRWPVDGTPTLLFSGDNVMSEVINIGNVPATGAIVPGQCVWATVTAGLIGASPAGFIKRRSISNNFPIREKLLGRCGNVACGCRRRWEGLLSRGQVVSLTQMSMLLMGTGPWTSGPQYVGLLQVFFF